MTDACASGLTADEVVFQRLYPGLHRFAAVVGGHETDPEDLVQEAVLKTLRRGPLSSIEAPAAYLRRAILNLAVDSHRTAGRRSFALSLLAHDQRTTEQSGQATPEVLDLLQARDRALLYLVDIEGYSLKEAGRLLGISHTAARSRASRARHCLREALRTQTGGLS